MRHSISFSSYKLNIVLLLLIVVNIVNTIYPKGQGYSAEDYVGFGYQLSKYINAATIAIMLPSLFQRIKVFTNMRYMVIIIVIYMMIAYGFGNSFNFSSASRSLMVCLSLVFFEDTLQKYKVNSVFLYGYVITFIVNIAFLVITQDRLGMAMENEGHIGGGQGIVKGMIFIIPLIFLVFKDKVSSYLFIFCGIVIFISMRRTAILTYFLCLPFIYKRISHQISRKAIFIFLILFVAITYYIVHNYWYVIEDRFSDMFEANEAGYYGSGRTGWWEVLVDKFLDNPQNWLLGFGLGSVTKTMSEAGFPWGSAHNDYLQVIFTYGLVGGFLWFSSFWRTVKISRKPSYKNTRPLIQMGASAYLFYALTSGGFQTIELISLTLFFNLALNHYTIHEKTSL